MTKNLIVETKDLITVAKHYGFVWNGHSGTYHHPESGFAFGIHPNKREFHDSNGLIPRVLGHSTYAQGKTPAKVEHARRRIEAHL